MPRWETVRYTYLGIILPTVVFGCLPRAYWPMAYFLPLAWGVTETCRNRLTSVQQPVKLVLVPDGPARKGVTNVTSTDEFLAQRAEWIALGRPTDHPYARQCAEVAAQASSPAIGIRTGDTYTTIEVV